MSCIRPYRPVGLRCRSGRLSAVHSGPMFRVLTYLAALLYAGAGVVCADAIPVFRELCTDYQH